eukprot:GHVP01065874.1.p1 GENE.GHVP01065874.1~~GHVP01065874.1.p1  ORF type:complete len:930 (-),score=160.04 GHVP01065874.1:2770-5559(-)
MEPDQAIITCERIAARSQSIREDLDIVLRFAAAAGTPYRKYFTEGHILFRRFREAIGRLQIKVTPLSRNWQPAVRGHQEQAESLTIDDVVRAYHAFAVLLRIEIMESDTKGSAFQEVNGLEQCLRVPFATRVAKHIGKDQEHFTYMISSLADTPANSAPRNQLIASLEVQYKKYEGGSLTETRNEVAFKHLLCLLKKKSYAPVPDIALKDFWSVMPKGIEATPALDELKRKVEYQKEILVTMIPDNSLDPDSVIETLYNSAATQAEVFACATWPFFSSDPESDLENVKKIIVTMNSCSGAVNRKQQVTHARICVVCHAMSVMAYIRELEALSPGSAFEIKEGLPACLHLPQAANVAKAMDKEQEHFALFLKSFGKSLPRKQITEFYNRVLLGTSTLSEKQNELLVKEILKHLKAGFYVTSFPFVHPSESFDSRNNIFTISSYYSADPTQYLKEILNPDIDETLAEIDTRAATNPSSCFTDLKNLVVAASMYGSSLDGIRVILNESTAKSVANWNVKSRGTGTSDLTVGKIANACYAFSVFMKVISIENSGPSCPFEKINGLPRCLRLPQAGKIAQAIGKSREHLFYLIELDRVFTPHQPSTMADLYAFHKRSLVTTKDCEMRNQPFLRLVLRMLKKKKVIKDVETPTFIMRMPNTGDLISQTKEPLITANNLTTSTSDNENDSDYTNVGSDDEEFGTIPREKDTTFDGTLPVGGRSGNTDDDTDYFMLVHLESLSNTTLCNTTPVLLQAQELLKLYSAETLDKDITAIHKYISEGSPQLTEKNFPTFFTIAKRWGLKHRLMKSSDITLTRIAMAYSKEGLVTRYDRLEKMKPGSALEFVKGLPKWLRCPFGAKEALKLGLQEEYLEWLKALDRLSTPRRLSSEPMLRTLQSFMVQRIEFQHTSPALIESAERVLEFESLTRKQLSLGKA